MNVIIQGGAMAKIWPLHLSVGENRRNALGSILHTLCGRGRVNLIISTNLGGYVCELTYETCPISLCAL